MTADRLAAALERILTHDDFALDARVVVEAEQALDAYRAQAPAEGDGGAPLPEPTYWRWDNKKTGGHGFHPIKGHGNPEWAHNYEWSPVFTADQMRAYRAAWPNVQPKGTVAELTDAEIERLISGITGFHSEMHLRHLIAKKVEREVTARFYLRDNGVTAKLASATQAPAPAQRAWVWNPAVTSWELVHAPGHWQQGALYAFGPTAPDPLAAPCAAVGADDARDAARYRWLLQSGWYIGPDTIEAGEGGGLYGYCNEGFDAEKLGQTIDAALNKSQP